MHKKKLNIVLLAALVTGLVACKATSRSPQAHEGQVEKRSMNNQAAKRNTGVGKPLPIQLAIGTFDPLSEGGPSELPPELTLKSYAENESGYYILQFKGPVLRKWKEEVIAAGAHIFDYIPQFAFLVKMDHQTRKVVKDMDTVRWMGIYQPGFRIAPDLMPMVSEKSDLSEEVIVSIFAGESISYLTSEMERLGGEILVVSGGKQKIRLKIPGNKIADLSRLNGIKYIERVPEFKLSPGTKTTGGVE